MWRSCRGAGGCRGNPGILGLEQTKKRVVAKSGTTLGKQLFCFFYVSSFLTLRSCRGDVAEMSRSRFWGVAERPKLSRRDFLLGVITFGRKRVIAMNSDDFARVW